MTDRVDESVEAETGSATVEQFQFDPQHVELAASICDVAFARTLDGYLAGAAIDEEASSRGIDPRSALIRALTTAASYPLKLVFDGRLGGCELNVAETGSWRPRLRDVDADTIKLWVAAAAEVSAPAAIARFEDLLFTRGAGGNGGARAARAANHYLLAVRDRPRTMDAVEATARAWTLARRVRNRELDGEIRQLMADLVDDTLTTTPGDWAPLVMPFLNCLAKGPLGKEAAADQDPVGVEVLLSRAARICTFPNDAARIANLRRGRPDADHDLIARDQFAASMTAADSASHPMIRMNHLNHAAEVATRYHLDDLKHAATAAMQGIDPSSLGFEHITTEDTLPGYIAEGFLADATRTERWQDGMTWFLHTLPPSGDVETLDAVEFTLLRALFPTWVFSVGGLPRTTASADEQHKDHERAFVARTHAENLGRMLEVALDRMGDKYGTPDVVDMVEYFTELGGRDVQMMKSLALGFRHFWAGDYESCVCVIVPKFEGAVRNLLLELGEGIYEVEMGNDPGGFSGLYTLVAKLDKYELDPSWSYFFRWLLFETYGANVRNELAHGLIHTVSPTYAALCLRAVAVLALWSGPADHGSRLSAHRTASGQPRATLPSALRTSPVDWRDRADRWIGQQLQRAWWAVEARRIRRRL